MCCQNATVQHVQLLRTPRVPQSSLEQLLRTRITRSPRTLPHRLLGPLGTLARLRSQRLGRRLPCNPAKAKLYGKGPRAVIWPPGHPNAPDAKASQASQPSRGKGTGTDPEARFSLLIGHWEAFANRLLGNRARKHMFKTMLVERRRRAIIMRGENVARRTRIHANPQYGPFRPLDIYEDSQDDDDDDDDDAYEPIGSVAPAASDALTAAAAPAGYLPPLVIGEPWMF